MLQLKTISLNDLETLVSQAVKLSETLNIEKNEIYKSIVKKALKSKKVRQYKILILPLLILSSCIFGMYLTELENMYLNFRT